MKIPLEKTSADRSGGNPKLSGRGFNSVSATATKPSNLKQGVSKTSNLKLSINQTQIDSEDDARQNSSRYGRTDAKKDSARIDVQKDNKLYQSQRTAKIDTGMKTRKTGTVN